MVNPLVVMTLIFGAAFFVFGILWFFQFLAEDSTKRIQASILIILVGTMLFILSQLIRIADHISRLV